MDEARVGQKGGVTHVWYQKGVRPRGVRQQGFSSAYLFGAVCPEREAGVALVLPEVSTAAMDVFLAELSRAVPAGTHASKTSNAFKSFRILPATFETICITCE